MVGMDCTERSMDMDCMQQQIERIDQRDSNCIGRRDLARVEREDNW